MGKGVGVESRGGRGEGLHGAGWGTLPPPLPREVWQEVDQLGQQGEEARGPWLPGRPHGSCCRCPVLIWHMETFNSVALWESQFPPPSGSEAGAVDGMEGYFINIINWS